MAKSNSTNKFIYLGDPQSDRLEGSGMDYSGWTRLLAKSITTCWSQEELADKSFKKLIVLGGDLVNDGDVPKEWAAFFDALKAAREMAGLAEDDIKVISATGNHRRVINYADVPEFAEKIQLPANGPEGFEKHFYSLDHGCIHFIVFNSNLMGRRDEEFIKYLRRWINSDLRDNVQPVTMAVMHHPMFTMGTSDEDEYRAKVMRDNYFKLLRKNGVDFILCGHQHMYSRTPDMCNKSGAGITQVMGLSGTKFFDVKDKMQMEAVVDKTPVATIFETDGKTIWMKTIAESGQVLDEYAKAANPAPERRCDTCSNYENCYVIEPVKPRMFDQAQDLRIIGDGIQETLVNIDEYPNITEVFSRRMRSGESEAQMTGKSLKAILESAGVDIQNQNMTFGITTKLGIQNILSWQDLFGGKYYDESGNEKSVEPLLTGDYQLVCGQIRRHEFNVRKWIVDIREIDVII